MSTPMSGPQVQPSNLAARVTPRAPCALLQIESSSLEATLEQISQDNARRLYPRLALFEALPGFKDKHQTRRRSDDEICEARRDFLDSFAYLCDVEKGGRTVTAAALQTLPKSDILWLAANEGIRDDVKAYATAILDRLKTVTLLNRSIISDEIFELVVRKCRPRIQFYKLEVHKYARICRMTLRYRERDETVTRLRLRLKKLSRPAPGLSMEGYIDLCYGMREEEIEHIKTMSTTAEDNFTKLAHYVWRLGATRSAVNTVVEAMITVPSLRRVSTIRRIIAPEILERTLHPGFISPHEVLHGIVNDSASRIPLQIHQAFDRLHHLDTPLSRPIFTSMVSRRTIVTRVHAELQLADTFSRSREINFVNDDKYIGCSKPACYFCYNWLCEHKHVYVQPATHHRIIPGCRGPDSDLNGAGAGILKDMYMKLSRQVGQDIFDFLQQNGQARRQYMSTEYSSRAPSQI